MATTATTDAISAREGRLRQPGTLRVRITNTMRVWAASDSTNQPDRDSEAAAWNTGRIRTELAKSRSPVRARCHVGREGCWLGIRWSRWAGRLRWVSSR